MENYSITQTTTAQAVVLHLKPERRTVTFTEDTIDNEEMNKKKSNSKFYLVCCIFRKKDCSSEESSGDDSVNGYERQPKYRPQH